jgi:hypothetical protein
MGISSTGALSTERASRAIPQELRRAREGESYAAKIVSSRAWYICPSGEKWIADAPRFAYRKRK